MIQRKSKTQEARDYPWPESYYHTFDARKRLDLLQLHMEDAEEAGENAFRMKLYQKRYSVIDKGKDSQTVDLFMKAWVDMAVSNIQDSGFFAKKKAIKKWTGFMKELCLTDFPCENEREAEMLREEWVSFFRQIIEVDLKDKTYGSSVFGLIPMRHDTLVEKIGAELELLTETVPEKLGLSEGFKPLHECAAKAYQDYEM